MIKELLLAIFCVSIMFGFIYLMVFLLTTYDWFFNVFIAGIFIVLVIIFFIGFMVADMAVKK